MLKNVFSLSQRWLFSIHGLVGVKLLTKLRLQFSHFNKHKFGHNFKDCVSLMCDSGAKTETTSHFFLGFQFFASERRTLRDVVYRLDVSIKHLNGESLIDVLLYSLDRFNGSKNKQILLHTICYIQASYQTFWKTSYWPVPIFVQLLLLCFSLVCLLKRYIQCDVLSYYFNLFTDFSFSKGFIADISYYVQHFTISVFVWRECWLTFCLRFF